MTESKYQQWSGGVVLALIMAALGIGFVGAVIAASKERERARYWREVAIDLAERTPGPDADAVLYLAECER